MDLATASAYVGIFLLVALNAWLVSRADVSIRRDDD